MGLEIIVILAWSAVLGLANTSLIICFQKWRWIEYTQIYFPQWFPSNCYSFCLPFWLAVIELIVTYFLGLTDLWYIGIGFISASISNHLIKANERS